MGSKMPMSRLEAHLNHKDGVRTYRTPNGKLVATLEDTANTSLQAYSDVGKFGWSLGNVYGDGDVFLRPDR